jgi:hypothetical protein
LYQQPNRLAVGAFSGIPGQSDVAVAIENVLLFARETTVVQPPSPGLFVFQ